jgi:hypothetical protein
VSGYLFELHTGLAGFVPDKFSKIYRAADEDKIEKRYEQGCIEKT